MLIPKVLDHMGQLEVTGLAWHTLRWGVWETMLRNNHALSSIYSRSAYDPIGTISLINSSPSKC